MTDAGIIQVISDAWGRSPATFSSEPLLALIRG
jgi:hypothetical protein